MPDTEGYCCPFCGWWRTDPYGNRRVRFDQVDPTTAPMYRKQRLSGKGRGSREATVETLETRGLRDLPEDIKEQMRNQAHKILDELEG